MFSLFFMNEYISSRYYETTEIINEIAITKVENSEWVTLGDSILTYTTDGANCINEKGVLQWNRAYQLQEPKVDVCGNIAVIGEFNGTSLYIVNDQKELGEIDTGMPIKEFCVSATGVVATVLDDGSTTWIYLFDTAGEELVNMKTTMQDSGYPVGIDLSENGMLLAVSYVYIQNVQIKSRVAFYNFGEIGQNKSDMLVSGYDYTEAIVPVVQFMDSDSIFALADNRLMTYEGKEIPLHLAEILLKSDVQSVVYSDSYIGLLQYGQELEEKFILTIYNTATAPISEIAFDLYYSEVLLTDQRVVIYSENELYIYRVNGELIYRERMSKLIQKVLLTNKDNKFIIVYEDNLQIIELR